MKKNILIIAPFTILKSEKGFNRFEYLADLLGKRGHNVKLVTSSFSHLEKTFRTMDYKQEHLNYQLILLEELGYKKNVSFSRIRSHHHFEKQLKNLLKELKQYPDIVYSAYPMIGSAYLAGKFAKERHIPFILDVQDIWPESINNVLKLPSPLLKSVLFPLTIYANKTYALADYIIAVSETYLMRATNANSKYKQKLIVYIGTDLKYFDESSIKQQVIKPDNEFWGTYIGTLSYSYDIPTLIKAAAYLRDNGYCNIKIKVFGSGPLEAEFKKVNREKGSPLEFMGHYSYEQLIPFLKNSNLALNALTSYSEGSITNKIGDYLAAGLPILNSSSNQEFINMVDTYQIGRNYNSGDFLTLAHEIIKYYKDQDLYTKFGNNARKLAEEKFDRRITYNSIVNLIESN